MDEKEIIDCAIEFIESLFANDYNGHDAEHSKRVYHNALILADTEPQCNRFIISLAALLHDVDDYKLFNTENNYNARSFLKRFNVEQIKVEYICEIINGVSFSKNRERPKTIEAQIVQDADRLDAIGAIGIARTFAYGGGCRRSINDTIQHFNEKLLRLKDEMNTVEGKRIAESRHDFMEIFLSELEKEMSI